MGPPARKPVVERFLAVCPVAHYVSPQTLRREVVRGGLLRAGRSIAFAPRTNSWSPMTEPAVSADPGATIHTLRIGGSDAMCALPTLGFVTAGAAHDLAFERVGFVSMRLPPPGLFNIAPKRFWGLVLRDFNRTRRTEPVLLDFLANLSSPALVARRWGIRAEYTRPLMDKACVSCVRDSECHHIPST